MATVPIQESVQDSEERTQPPFLRRVRIQGYKSIAFCDVSLQPLTILVGRNAAGKSNFIDALAFLRDSMEVGVAEAVKRRGTWASVVCQSFECRNVAIEIEAGLNCGRPYRLVRRNGQSSLAPPSGEAIPNLEGIAFKATYRLELTARPLSSPTIGRESLEISDATKQFSGGFDVHEGVIERWRSVSDSSGTLPLPHSADLLSVSRPDYPLLGMIGTQPFLDFGDGLRNMGFCNFYPDAIRRPQKPNPGWLLEKDGHNLASVIEGLKEIDPGTVQRVRDYLSLIAEEVESFDVVRYGEYETVRFRLRGGTEAKPIEFDAASMSDGTLRALAALLAAFQIHLPTGPTVVGIEEPETALHPAAMRALVDALDEATQRTQVILTTHSADLLAGRDVTPGQVLIVRNRNGQTCITPVDKASREIVEKELYSLADLQRMDRLDLDETDLKRQDGLRNGAEGT